MKLYNTLTRKEEEFKSKNKIKMYTCGPTVYDYAHIGNFRSYVFADILKRFLKLKGFSVDHVMNITDVDDKIIKKMREEGKSLKDLTGFYLEVFMEDMKNMNMDMDYKKIPKATESINDMVKLIEDLLDKGFAYKKDDGIYFDVKRFENYGKLANIDITKLKSGARVNQDEYDKDNAQDFALWKLYRDEDGPVFWENSLGKGRPGWHVECSAMCIGNLDKEIDIHTGGVDLVFPHHTNEIAQTEASTGKHFVRYWIHNEHLMVNGKKMAKSLGNFYRLRDLIDKGYDHKTIRFFLLMSHYRSQANLTIDALDSAKSGLERINELVNNLKSIDGNDNENIHSMVESFEKGWERRMDEDLNTPESISLLFEFVKTMNKEIENGMSKENANEVLDVLHRVDSVFGILDEDKPLPPGAKEIIEQREIARKNKDFESSDQMREQLLSMGVEVKDDGDKTVWRVL